MSLPTYTSIWRIERRLYKLYDWVLPMPVSIPQAVIFMATFALWGLLLLALRVEPQASTGWLFLVPPGLAAWASAQPLIEEKRPHELAVSQVRYLLEPRRLQRLSERREARRVHLTGTVWTPKAQ